MSQKSKKAIGSILIIEDNQESSRQMANPLAAAGYQVTIAKTAKQAFAHMFKVPADLIILDINLQDLDGFHIAKELKRNMMLRHIPVILISNRSDFLEKMRTLDVVVDEYLVKPIDPQELVLRVKLVLQRVQSSLDANPLTRLPGNTAIVKAIKAKIASKKPYAVGYADLNNFKAYNDKYGFNQGDKVIRLAAQVVMNAVQKFSPQDNFVGHIGGDDFIFVSNYDKADEICEYINTSFDKEIPKYYNEEDQKKGYIVVEDRRGVVSQFPFVGVAIGLVSDEGEKFSNLGQINHSLTQLKKYAKSFQGSAYVRDRRTLTNKIAEFTFGPGAGKQEGNGVLENIAKALGSYMPGKLTEIMEKKQISVLFQPILNMASDDVEGHEGLIRGPAGTPLEFPDALFKTARGANCVPALDMLCMRQILGAATDFHRGMKLFLNIFPETLAVEDELEKTVLSHPRAKDADVIFELSGSHREGDIKDLFSSLEKLKKRNVKICLDSSLALSEKGFEILPDLRPDFVKINMMMYKDMSKDREKLEQFVKAVLMVRHAGSEAICAKLESRADSYLALRYGINLGQGFLFARPSMPSASDQLKSA